MGNREEFEKWWCEDGIKFITEKTACFGAWQARQTEIDALTSELQDEMIKVAGLDAVAEALRKIIAARDRKIAEKDKVIDDLALQKGILKAEVGRLTDENAALKAAPTPPAQLQKELDDADIRAIALDCGFKLKLQPGGTEDLNPYVYRFAREILSTLPRAEDVEALRQKLTPLAPEVEPHSDDVAVDRFALVMKEKLAKARAKGRCGWDDPARCTVEHLQSLLHTHLAKGDPVDVGNFAMMLHQRGGSTTPPEVEPVAEVVAWLGGIAINGIGGKITRFPVGTKLYLRPANDGLRKAAEEVIEWWDNPKEHDVGCYPGVREKLENLRAELDKDKSC